MKQKKATSAKEKRVLRFLTDVIKKEGIKADVGFYDERGVRLAAFMCEGVFRDHIRISRELLAELTEKEAKAIGLHEIGHVKYGHSGKRVVGGLYSIMPFFIIIFAIWSIVQSLGLTAPPTVGGFGSSLFTIVAVLWGLHFGSKRTQWVELQADSYAKRKIGSSRAVIAGVRKTIEYQWKQKKARKFWRLWNMLLPTHPTFENRRKNLKENLVPAP